MNPLSAFTFFRRHGSKSIVLIALFAMSAAGVTLFISLAVGIYISPSYAVNAYLEEFSLVQSDGGIAALDQNLSERIAASPDVERVIMQTNIRIKIPNVGGAYFPFRIFGLDSSDIAAVLDTTGVALKEGRLPEPSSNGVALSEEIVRALGLKIGDTFDQTRDGKLYLNIEHPLELTGILAGPVRLGIMSREFLRSGVLVNRFATNGLLVIGTPDRKIEAAEFLSTSIAEPGLKIYTGRSRVEDVRKDQELLYLLGIPIVLLLTLGMVLVMRAINRLDFIRRLGEFGTLLAVGKERAYVARRLTGETALPAFIGTGAGILLSWAVLAALNPILYAPQGFSIPPIDVSALPFAAAILVAVTAFSYFFAFGALRHADVVSIIERGESPIGRREFSSRVSRGWESRIDPLSAIVFVRRHFRQTLLAAVVMFFLIIATALVIFVFSAGADALRPALNDFNKVSAVVSNGRPLSGEVRIRIEENPDVERVIPVYDFSPLKISIPPMFPDHPVLTLCVPEDGMSYLVGLYGLRLAEGRLPHPDTNEIVLPWAVAQNRDIEVGDVIGDPERPVYPNASALPVALTVSGIFAPADYPAEETWFSFMSLEFIEPWRIGPQSLIVAPVADKKTAVDEWLRANIASKQTIVYTQKDQKYALGKEMRSLLLTFSIMESLTVIIAVVILAGLFYSRLFYRKGEFGVLLALGQSRREIIMRTVLHNAFISALAWVAGMLSCLGFSIFLQFGVYESAGLVLNIFNPLPWLFTLPVPIATVLAGFAAACKILSPLDPVAIIERH